MKKSIDFRLGIAVGILSLSALSALSQTQEIRVFSHRGGRMEHDENTMEAFVASHKAGYTGYETDIRMTKDGELIVTHDSKLDRTTNGSGAVEEKTLVELRKLNTKKGNKMITLDELMDFLKGKPGLYVEFEMKTNPESLYPEESLPEYVDKLYKKVMSNKPSDAEFLFTSSDTRALRCMQRRHPDAELLLITSEPVSKATVALCKGLGIKRLGSKMEGTSREAVKYGVSGFFRWAGESIKSIVWPV